jgi:hypothetical protein
MNLLPNFIIAGIWGGRTWGGVPLDTAFDLDAAMAKKAEYEKRGYAYVTIYAMLPGGAF